MARFLYPNSFLLRRRIRCIFLAVFWMLGLYFGFRLSLRADATFLSWMCRVGSRPVSILGMAGGLFLPFLCSALVVSLGQNWLLPVIAFLKAWSFASIAWGLWGVYPSGGWLAVGLLQFSSILAGAILWVFWLRPGEGGLGPYLLALALVGCGDYFVISPLLVSL